MSAPHQVEADVTYITVAPRGDFGFHAGVAKTQSPLKRGNTLPIDTVERVAVGLALAQRVGIELLPIVLVVAIRAGQVHLTLACHEKTLAVFKMPFGCPVNLCLQRQATRAAGDGQSHGHQLIGLKSPFGGFLVFHTAVANAVFQVKEFAGGFVDGRVASRYALHFDEFTMAGLAAFVAFTVWFGPRLGAAV